MGTRELKVLKGINLEVNDSEMVAIMGASGSGKSTLLNILGLLDTPTAGNYFLEDKEVSCLSRQELALVRSQKVGFIFQQFNLLPHLSALANVELGMQYSTGVDRQQALEALDRVGLAPGKPPAPGAFWRRAAACCHRPCTGEESALYTCR